MLRNNLHNSIFWLHQGTKRASHGLDFDGSRTFKWDGSRRHKYIQSKKEKQAISMHTTSRAILRPVPGQMGMPPEMMGGMVMGGWQTPMEPPGRPMPVHPGAPYMGGPPHSGMYQYPWGSLQAFGHPLAHPSHYGVPPAHMHYYLQEHPHVLPSYPMGASVPGAMRPGAPGGVMSPGASSVMQPPPPAPEAPPVHQLRRASLP